MHLSALIQQKPYEQIKYSLRRHPITFLPTVLLLLVLISLPIALYFLFNALYPGILTADFTRTLLVLAGSIYYLSILLFFYTRFIEFYLDLWIITNDRLVDVEQHGLFARSISELDLFQIQDITSEIHGMFATFLNYGTLFIKTASDNTNIIAYDIHRPNIIREDLIRLAEEDRKHHHVERVEAAKIRLTRPSNT